MMKALVLQRPSYPPQAVWENVEESPPGPWDVKVALKAASLNPIDWKAASWDTPDWSKHRVMGLDGAGVVEALGSQVTSWAVGDRVFFHGDLGRPGSLAQKMLVDSRVLSWLPDGVSFAEGAALPCAGMTAYQGLFRKAKVERDKTILIYGAAGGVGGFAFQLALLGGLKVFALASASKGAFVESLVPPVPSLYTVADRQGDWEKKAREWTQGRGFDYIFSTVNAEVLKADLGRLAYGGHLISAAGLPDLGGVEAFGPSPSVHEVALGACYNYEHPAYKEDLGRMGQEMAALVLDKKLNPMITETLTPLEVPEALARLHDQKTMGKIVVNLEGAY